MERIRGKLEFWILEEWFARPVSLHLRLKAKFARLIFRLLRI